VAVTTVLTFFSAVSSFRLDADSVIGTLAVPRAPTRKRALASVTTLRLAFLPLPTLTLAALTIVI
jgi:hypothetical protein